MVSLTILRWFFLNPLTEQTEQTNKPCLPGVPDLQVYHFPRSSHSFSFMDHFCHKHPNLEWLSPSTLCGHIKKPGAPGERHINEHISFTVIHCHQLPCCLNISQSLILILSNLSSTHHSISNHLCSACPPTQLPLPYFHLYIGPMAWPPTSERKLKPHLQATKATNLPTSTPILSFSPLVIPQEALLLPEARIPPVLLIMFALSF